MTTIEGVDVSEEEQEGMECLVDSLLEEEILSTLVHNLNRTEDNGNPLAAGAESQATHNTLGKCNYLL